jgi:2-polyprenyl-6-hydroxyphenyl methylase / 3-demethylubiquinone-9 3-methyltransferase
MTADGTVDRAEIARFAAMAAEWWAPEGKFRPLHRLNPLRLAYIRDTACARFGGDPRSFDSLKGLSIADVGCGGGLLAEPLARLGADVLGIDAGEDAVRVATAHAAETETPVTYRHATVETLAGEGRRFDIVLAMEILEHVADTDLFLAACARVLKPGGLLFVATLNRTPKSFLAAVVAAEWVLRWLPRGTHDWKRFVRPAELAAALGRQGLTVGGLTGLVYAPLADDFRLAPRDLDINYMGWAHRAGDHAASAG